MIKLQYNPTYEFATYDIFMVVDPPIYFEAQTRLNHAWAEKVSDLIADESQVDLAVEAVGMAIISVCQDGEKTLINGYSGANELYQTLEKISPGHGDGFMVALAIGHYHYHFRKLVEVRGNWNRPSTPPVDGNKQKQSRSVAKPA